MEEYKKLIIDLNNNGLKYSVLKFCRKIWAFFQMLFPLCQILLKSILQISSCCIRTDMATLMDSSWFPTQHKCKVLKNVITITNCSTAHRPSSPRLISVSGERLSEIKSVRCQHVDILCYSSCKMSAPMLIRFRIAIFTFNFVWHEILSYRKVHTPLQQVKQDLFHRNKPFQ